MRYVIAAASAALLLAGCGNGTPTVGGVITDTLITSSIGCNPSNGTLQVVLTDASGKAIARDQATFTWRHGACVVPFTFAAVPPLPGYGIRVAGLGGMTWLTPAQAAQEVTLRLTPAYTLTRG
jgi:hypothetical protein